MVTMMVVQAADGADIIDVTGNRSGTVNSVAFSGIGTIDGRQGNDIFTLGNGSNSLDPLAGTMTLTGGADTDVFNINDQGDTDASTYGLDANAGTFTRTGMATMTFGDQFENLTLNAGTAADTINITSSSSTTFTLEGGGGADVVSIAGTISTTGDTTLNTAGSVTQVGSITAATLFLEGGTFDLNDANNVVANLDADNTTLTGDLTFRNDAAFIIDGIDAGANNVELSSTNTVTEGGVITAAGLSLLGVGGDYDLDTSNHVITTLAGNTGGVDIQDNIRASRLVH